MHLLLRLPDGIDDATVAREALDAGIRVEPLSAYRLVSKGAGGLVIGYEPLHGSAVAPAIRALERVVRPRLRAADETAASIR